MDSILAEFDRRLASAREEAKREMLALCATPKQEEMPIPPGIKKRHMILYEFVPKFFPFTTTITKDREKAKELCVALIYALMAKAVLEYPLEASVPPPIDQFWHILLLETSLYQDFCQKTFGRMLHHTSLSASDDVDIKNKRVDMTRAIYETLFTENTSPEISTLEWAWVREEQGRKKRVRPYESSVFQIFVKELSGLTITFRASPTMKIITLKRMIEIIIPDSPVDGQRLIYAGKQFEDGLTLEYYKVGKESTIHLVKRLRGC